MGELGCGFERRLRWTLFVGGSVKIEVEVDIDVGEVPVVRRRLEEGVR